MQRERDNCHCTCRTADKLMCWKKVASGRGIYAKCLISHTSQKSSKLMCYLVSPIQSAVCSVSWKFPTLPQVATLSPFSPVSHCLLIYPVEGKQTQFLLPKSIISRVQVLMYYLGNEILLIFHTEYWNIWSPWPKMKGWSSCLECVMNTEKLEHRWSHIWLK